jgi:hypothetical protein
VLNGPRLPRQKIELTGRSLMCFVAEPMWKKLASDEVRSVKD